MALWCMVAVMLLATACSQRVDALQNALALAGDNRSELEQVLQHYEGDSLKLEAARFLIEYMPGHFSRFNREAADGFDDAVDLVLTENPKITGADIRAAIDSIGSLYYDGRSIEDVKCITADFLIKNIDRAFELWQTGPWAKHVSFADFCELLLPYKAQEMQPFDNWRDDLLELTPTDFADMQYCDEMRNVTLQAAILINNALGWRIGGEVEMSEFPFKVLRPTTLLHMPSGTCRDFAAVTALAMRAQGIPTAIDFTPLWAAGGSGHTWCAVLAGNGKMEPFSPPFTPPGNAERLNDRAVKVYRRTYAANPDLQQLLRCERIVPAMFHTWFIKDVTDEYMAVHDVDVKCDKSLGYAYLAMYDNRQWRPVAFAKVDGGCARFHNVGGGALFMPIAMDEHGNVNAIADPFVLSLKGQRTSIHADWNGSQSMTLTRKYPVRQYVYEVTRRMVGGEFQASNSPDFRQYATVYRITDCAAEGHAVTLPDSLPAYRYWRYKQDRLGTYSNMAEIAFYAHTTDSVAMRGTIIGTLGSLDNEPNRNREAVFDGNYLTYFNPPLDAMCWTGMDFGKAVKLQRIDFTPRGDGNTIEPGDVYELLIWDADGWKSLGRQTATGLNVTFTSVPTNGLYRLHNCTKGAEERPFTYENGRQVWW